MANTIQLTLEVDDKGSAVIKRFSGTVVDKVRDMSTKSTGHVSKLQSGFAKITGATGKFSQSLTNLKTIAMGAFVGWGMEKIASSFLTAARVTEDFKTRLTVLLGSVTEGNRLFEAMSHYAGKVPFTYEKVMAAATQLSGVMKGGVAQIKQWMPMIGDLAAAAGLGIETATEQVIRMYSAGAGAADLFRERGVLAMMGFKAGVSYTAEETRKLMMEAWTKTGSQFKGATALMAKTWSGMTSMLSDAWFQFRNKVMEAGIFDALKQGLGMVLEKIEELKTTGKLDEWARDMGTKVLSAFQIIIKGAGLVGDAFLGWQMIWQGLKGAFAAFFILIAEGFDKSLGLLKKGYEYLIKYYETQNKIVGWIPGLKTDTDAYRAAIEALGGAQGFAGEMQGWLNEEFKEADKALESLVGQTDKQDRAITALIATLEKMKTGMEGAGNAQKGAATGTKETTAAVDTLTASLVSLTDLEPSDLGLPTDYTVYTKGLQDTGAAINSLTASLVSLNDLEPSALGLPTEYTVYTKGLQDTAAAVDTLTASLVSLNDLEPSDLGLPTDYTVYTKGLQDTAAAIKSVDHELALIEYTLRMYQLQNEEIWRTYEKGAEISIKEWRKMRIESDSFFDGLEVGFYDVIKLMYTWGQAGYQIVKGFAQAAQSAFSNMFFDAMTGKFKDFQDYWQALWHGMARTVADVAAQMLTKWVATQVAMAAASKTAAAESSAAWAAAGAGAGAGGAVSVLGPALLFAYAGYVGYKVFGPGAAGGMTRADQMEQMGLANEELMAQLNIHQGLIEEWQALEAEGMWLEEQRQAYGVHGMPYPADYEARFAAYNRALGAWEADYGQAVARLKDWNAAIAASAQTVQDALSNALRLEGTTLDRWESFTMHIKQSLYDSILEGMVSAFMQSAVYQAAIAPTIMAIQDAFDTAMESGTFDAEAFYAAVEEPLSELEASLQALRPAFDYMSDAAIRIEESLGVNRPVTGSAPITGSAPVTFQYGTPYVPRTGMYVLHEGEAVIPASSPVWERGGQARLEGRASRTIVIEGDINIVIPESAAPQRPEDWRYLTREFIIPEIRRAGNA